MYYLDANAFIYPALYDGEKASGATRLLRSITEGERGGATASLTVDEVVYALLQAVDRATAIEQGRRVLGMANLKILDVEDIHVVRALNALDRWDELSPRDAIHYGVMATNGIHTIATDDADFAAIPDVERRPLEWFEAE